MTEPLLVSYRNLTRWLLCAYRFGHPKVPRVLVASLWVLACSGSARAQQSDLWKGGTGNWSNATNWTGGVPTTTSLVSIGNGDAASSNVTLDINTNVLALAVGEGDTLVLQGFPTPQTLTAGSFSSFGTTDIGGGASLVIQNFSENSGVINLATTTINPELAPLPGEITGTGTLSNALGVIAGAGKITTDIQNSGFIFAQGGTLTLTGNVTNTGNGGVAAQVGGVLTLDGAHVTGGTFSGLVSAVNGATVGDTTLSKLVTLTSGSNLGIQGTVNNVAGLTLNGGSTLNIQGTLTSQLGLGINLGSGGQGATINGAGSIVNIGGMGGVGTISTNIQNGTSTFNFGVIEAGAGQLVLKGNIDNTFGTISASLGSGFLVLDGAHVTGGEYGGGILMAQNGATMKDVFIVTGTNFMFIENGSTLGIEGTVTNGDQTIFLGTLPGPGVVTLNGSGTLVNLGAVVGAGILDVAVTNKGFLDADLSGRSLVLEKNVTGNGEILVNHGAILTLDKVTVQAASVLIGGTLNGNGTIVSNVVNNGGTLSPGDAAPGLLNIVGNYTQTSTGSLDILLGGTGVDQFGQLDISGLASLDGTLDVALFGGFDPTAGDVFEILQAGSINGDLAQLIFPTLDNGLFFKLDQERDGIFLDVLGGTGGGSGGGGGTGGGTATPEPGSLLLLACGLLALSISPWHRKRRRLDFETASLKPTSRTRFAL